MNCEQRTDSIYLYAVGALPDDEADDLRRHLATGCPACTGLLAEASAAAGMIPLADPPAVVPPGMKERLMARVDAAPRPAADDVPDWSMRLFRLLVPAAVAAGIAVVVTHFVMNKKLVATQTQLVEIYNQKQSIQNAVIQQQIMIETMAPAGQMVRMMQSPGLKLVTMQPTDQQPGAVANLLYDPTTRKWAMVVNGMKKPAAGQTFEVWFIAGGAPRRAGLFDVNDQGSAYVVLDLPDNLGTPTVSAVTNEKTGGSDVPTGQFQLKGSIQ